MTARKISFFAGMCLGMLGAASIAFAGESSEAAASSPANTPPAGHLLRKIVLAESVEVAQTFDPPPDSSFVALSPALSSFDHAELTKRLSSGENRVIEERLLAAIAQVIENFLRQNNYPTATAVIPSQNIADGTLRLIVQLGPTTAALAEQAQNTAWKIRNINVQGARWFSESLLRQKLRIEQGGIIKYTDLDQAINWTNNNPFRRVRVRLDPIPNTGEADLTIAVQEALPLRLTASFDNAGNDLLGNNRFIAAINYANLWGLDHQLSYQYITTNLPDVYQGQGLDYRVPLPWRHYVQLSSSYLRARPEFAGGLFLQDGETLTSDLRYTIPLRSGHNPIEAYVALSFKETNNNLTWDPHFTNVAVQSTKTDIFQLTAGASAIRRDKRGAWGFGANLTLSPGGINSRNSDAAFHDSRWGATSRYAYASVSGQRLLNIKAGWDLATRAILQVADGNLLPSEQLSIGGGSSARGFPENISAGDQGFVITNDLLFPAWKLQVPRLSKTRGPLETRFLVFYDAANCESKHPVEFDPKRKPLASAGIGLRMSLATNFSLSADYGWQLTRLPYPVEERSRGHIKLTFAY